MNKYDIIPITLRMRTRYNDNYTLKDRAIPRLGGRRPLWVN